MIEVFIGMIVQFGFNFEPQYWSMCHGQQINISQNQVLYSLLGNTFGGDGKTFNLPDLRVKRADGSYYRQGEKMPNGLPYIESYICVANAIYPSRP